MKIKDHQEIVQVLYGTSIVQFDAMSQNIGLKGNSFFTISYCFIANVSNSILNLDVFKNNYYTLSLL